MDSFYARDKSFISKLQKKKDMQLRNYINYQCQKYEEDSDDLDFEMQQPAGNYFHENDYQNQDDYQGRAEGADDEVDDDDIENQYY